ncbi:DUF6221 family protein [Nocardioides sp. BYT-33-1]|uniref:DUF6221 family protein n=1 Tax=Nocardioides sp. BYT-33-1 TaxID=3416952 RepID=UPI003F53E484
MTITEFLLARIAEDELEVGPADPDEGAGPNGIGWAEVGALSEVLMARPSRMLAECEAKRRIVELAQSVDGEERYAAEVIGGVDGNTVDTDGAGILRALASVYADHPDFDPTWQN